MPGTIKKVRTASGVGNCASSLVQGVRYYRDAKLADTIPGLMHVELGGCLVRDIEFSAAFDVVASKVGKDLGQAIFAHPNHTLRFSPVPSLRVPVHRWMTHDGSAPEQHGDDRARQMTDGFIAARTGD